MKSSESLFLEWKKERPGYKYFCEDGILVESEWEKANPKILFLLKETYIQFTTIKGPMGPGKLSCTFWRKLQIATYVITEYINGRTPELNTAYKIKEEPNVSIACMNIKKNAEKYHESFQLASDDKDILSYVKTDRDFLLRQINLISPDIVFCCETIDFAKELFPGLSFLSKNVYSNDKMLFVDYLHPNNKNGYEQGFDNISAIMEGYCKISQPV